MTQTLEAYADTLIPGEKRFPADVAIAGVVSGAGAVQGGAIEMMNFAPVGFEPALPGLALLINLYALAYAICQRIVLDLAVPPFVALDFASRTALLVEILDPGGQTSPRSTGSRPFVSSHTTRRVTFQRWSQSSDGHPGLAAIGFPPPNPDGVWRFPRVLVPARPRAGASATRSAATRRDPGATRWRMKPLTS